MPANGFLYQIRAEAEKDEAEILIYDEIGADWFGEGITADRFVKDLAKVKAKQITVRINSAGGEVFEGLAIHNALRRHDARVVTVVDGIAASIASVIALAGAEVRIADNALFMVHNPSGFAYGDAATMREYAELLDKVGGSLAGVYVAKTGKDVTEVQAWMDAETWFDAAEAKAAGLVDTIVEGKKVRACADVRAFRNAPAALRAALEEEAEKEDGEEEPAAAAEGAPPGPEEDDDEDKPAAAGGRVEPAKDSAPTPSARKAQEETMSDKDTAAQTIAAERERVKTIRAVAASHKIDAAKVETWTDSDMTLDQVNAAILVDLRARAAGAPNIRTATGVGGVRDRTEDDPRAGFPNHRDYLLAVIENSGAYSRANVKDERLRLLAAGDDEGPGMAFMLPRAFAPRDIRAAAGSDEQGNYADTYGGFLKPTQVQPGLLQLAFEGDPTAGLTTMVPMGAPVVKFNARTDKNHATSVSGGLTFTRTPETAAATPSRMAIEQITLEAQPLVGAAYATEQVLTDSPVSFAALLAAGFNAQRAAHILNEKIRGGGGNEYLGVLNAACKVEIAKETNQPADTIVYDNVLNMRARCWSYSSAVWMANHDCLPQLAKMSLAIGTGGTAVYVPGTFGGRPDTLLGQPILYTEYCNTVGDAGDLILVVWSEFLEGIYQPMRSDESIHVRFLNLERTFRFYERNAGAPWWRSALTPAKGSNTLSPVVTLAARA